MKGFYPQFDFPDQPFERLAMVLAKELIASACDKRDGLVIRRPDLHAAGIELGILAIQRMIKQQSWSPSPGPPLSLILSLGYEKACECSGGQAKGDEERASSERPIKK